MLISPDDIHHARLQHDVETFITNNDAECFHYNIHKLDPELSNKLRYRTDPLSKILCSKPDTLVIPKPPRYCFWVDYKTSTEYLLDSLIQSQIMVVEALQIVMHKAEYIIMNVPCVYILRDKLGNEGAFTFNNMPPILEMLQPRNTRYTADMLEKLKSYILLDNQEKLRMTRGSSGPSNDPMIIFAGNRMRPWRDVIRELLGIENNNSSPCSFWNR